jgi:acetyl esterase/lipase
MDIFGMKRGQYERMNPIKKAVFKGLSVALISVKKHYRLYRGILMAPFVLLRPIFRALDHKMMVLDREIPVRVFKPGKNGSGKVLIFFHGGGWVTGNIDTYTPICANMARVTKCTVVSVNYRLAPETPFPGGLEDCYYVTQEILADPCIVGCEIKDITLVGDSAGGNLAAVISLMARDKGVSLPQRQILIYPATHYDHSENSPFQSVRDYGEDYILTAARIEEYMELYTQNEENRHHPYVAPILAPDLSGQPKTLIITGEFDPLRDEGEAYGQRLRAFGNEVRIFRLSEAIHGFLALPKKARSVTQCYEHIMRFLNDEDDAVGGL